MAWLLWMPIFLAQMTQMANDDIPRTIAHDQTTPLYPNGRVVYNVGKATYYSSGLMENVARTRGIKKGEADGFATYPDCKQIGNYLMVSVLNPRNGKWSSWHKKRIVDCSEPVDYKRHIAEGLVELSYEQALDYGYLSEGRTSIRFYLVR